MTKYVEEKMQEAIDDAALEMQGQINFLASPRIRGVHWEWERKRNGKVKLTLTFKNTQHQHASIILDMPEFKEGDILWGGYDFMRDEEWPCNGCAKAKPSPIGSFR